MRRALPLLVLLLTVLSLADLPREEWRVTRQITLPKLDRRTEVYLPLDRDALTVDSLSEYRVVQAGKTEVPYRMLTEAGSTESRPLPDEVVKWTTSQDTAGQDQSAQIVLDLGADQPAVNRLDFDIAGEVYRCRVRIEESADPSAPGKTLFQGELYRQGPGFQKTFATFPDSGARYLRLTVTRTLGKTFRLQRVSPVYVLNLPRRLDLVPSTLTRTEEAKRRRTVLELDLGKPSRDLVMIELIVAEPTFDRQVWMEASLKADPPQYEMVDIADLKRLKATQPVALRLALDRTRKLRLTIDNGDDKPLTISTIKIWRVRRGLTFLANPQWEYELWYGNPKATQPSYEVQRLPLTHPPAALPLATLGPAQITPPPPPPPPPWSESHPTIFWAALVVVVLLLGLIIVKAIRSVRV